MGPILYRLASPLGSSPAADLLLGADLTARLLAGRMSEATEEILRAAGPAGSQIVLLKGAAAQRHYPEPHLRLMGDVDLLVPPALYDPLQTLLRDLGYVQQADLPATFFETHHHAMPFFHPERRLWVEVHRGLFPATWACASDPCFATPAVLATSIPITFGGIEARALSNEMHLIYTCTHWAGSFSLFRGLPALVDVIYLLHHGAPLDWEEIQRNSPGGWARRSVGLMLGFLKSHRAIDLDTSAATFVGDCLRPLGKINTRLLYWLLDRYLVGRYKGRMLTEPNVRNLWDRLLLPERSSYLNLLQLPVTLLFPPNRKDRFSPLLAARRIRSFLRSPP